MPKNYERMSVEIMQPHKAARVAIIACVKEELHGALEQLVVALQCEHVSMTASGAPSSVSASQVDKQRRSWGSSSAASQACDAVDLQTGITHSLKALFYDQRLRQFVVVWIATALTCARVDGIGGLADAVERFSQNRCCRVGWAAEGACIALVAALKAADSDARRQSITNAFSSLVAQYSFSKAFDFKMHPLLLVRIDELMEALNAKSKYDSFFNIDSDWMEILVHRFSFCDGLGTMTNLQIARMFWELALDSLSSDSLLDFSRAFVALFRKAESDRARNVLLQVVHAHHKTSRVITHRHGSGRIWQEFKTQVIEWKPTNVHGSTCHVQLLAALVAEGALEALTQVLNCATTSRARACAALAISALASAANICHDADGGLAFTAACARDALRTALHNVWMGRSHLLFANGHPCLDEQSIHEYEIIAAALHDLRSSSTAPVHGVNALWKRIPQTKSFAFYGDHTFSDGSKYKGLWVETTDDQPPHPTLEDTPGDDNRRSSDHRGTIIGTDLATLGISLGGLDDAIIGRMHSKGVMLYCNGDSYKGEWVEGRKSGKGVYKWSNGDFFAGRWMEGMPEIMITKEYLYRSKRAVLIQKAIRRHLSRLQVYKSKRAVLIQKAIRRHLSRSEFQKLRATSLFHGHLILNGCDRMAVFCPFTLYPSPFFARPLADFIAQIGCASRLRLARARFCVRPGAAWPLLHAARGSARGCLSAINQHELCRNRSREVVFIVGRLMVCDAQLMPTVYISDRCLLRFSGSIVERVLRGYCRRVMRVYEYREHQAERVSWSSTAGSTMIEVD